MNKPLIRFVAMALALSFGLTTAYAGAHGGGTKISAGTSRPVVSNATVAKPNPGPAPQPQPQPQPQTQPQQSTNHRSSIIGTPGTRSSTIGTPGSRSSTIGTPGSRSSTIGSLASPGGTATNSMIGSLGNADLSSIIGNTTPAVTPVPGPDPKPGPGPDPKPGPGPGPGPRPHNEVVGVEYYDTGVGVEVGVSQTESAAPAVAPQVEQVMQNMPSAEQIQQMARQLQGPVTQQVEQAVQQLPQPMQEKLNEPIIILPRSVNAGNGSRTTRSNSNSTYGIPGMSGGNGNGPLIYNP